MWWTGAVGASGAVFGLFGAFLVLQRRLGRSSAGMYVIIGINAVIGFVIPGIAWQAHLGGLLTGAAVAAAIAYTGRNRGPLEPAPDTAGALGLDGRHPHRARRADPREVRPGRLRRRAVDYTRVIRPQWGQPLWITSGLALGQRQRVVIRKPESIRPKPTPRFQRPRAGTGYWAEPEM